MTIAAKPHVLRLDDEKRPRRSTARVSPGRSLRSARLKHSECSNARRVGGRKTASAVSAMVRDHDTKPLVLVADDDSDDRELLLDAFDEIGATANMKEVANGEELLDYLKRRGRYADAGASPRPDVILLDLNMPGVGGHDALRQIRSDDGLRAIPVIIFSTSRSPEDMRASYKAGANTYLCKPMGWKAMLSTAQKIKSHWLDIVQLPRKQRAASG